MPWLTEKLIGTINGTNRNFTLTHVPVVESMLIALNRPFERVGTQPDTMEYQYAVNSNEIELGTAPTTEAERPWCKYFWDDTI